MPTALQGGSLANASDNDGAKHYQNSAALPYFYAPHHHFSFLISNSSEGFIRSQDCPRSLPFPIEACMEKPIKDALLFEKTKNGLTQQMMIQILFFICVPVFSALVLLLFSATYFAANDPHH